MKGPALIATVLAGLDLLGVLAVRRAVTLGAVGGAVDEVASMSTSHVTETVNRDC